MPRSRILAAIAVLIIPMGTVGAWISQPIPADTPPSLDRFLSDVRHVIPTHARLLTAGLPSALVFYRATYRLYPRTVVGYLVKPYTAVFGWVGSPPTWITADHYAKEHRAAYVALWHTTVAPPAALTIFSGDGGVIARVGAS